MLPLALTLTEPEDPPPGPAPTPLVAEAPVPLPSAEPPGPIESAIPMYPVVRRGTWADEAGIGLTLATIGGVLAYALLPDHGPPATRQLTLYQR